MGRESDERGRAAAVVGSALVGALCGVLAAAFGSLISGSLGAVAATVLAGSALGVWAGRLPGALVGAICGALAAAFGHIIGGTPVGVALTIAGGAVLAGWVCWAQEPEARLHYVRWPDPPAHGWENREVLKRDSTKEPVR